MCIRWDSLTKRGTSGTSSDAWALRSRWQRIVFAPPSRTDCCFPFVFGAHLGFDASLRERYSCIFVNLEQLGEGGAELSPGYQELLEGSVVVDYDIDNVAAYTTHTDDVPVVPFLYAPYLSQGARIPLEERPIDLLFIGSMNERRRAIIDRIEAQGVEVSIFDRPLFGGDIPGDRSVGCLRRPAGIRRGCRSNPPAESFAATLEAESHQPGLRQGLQEWLVEHRCP